MSGVLSSTDIANTFTTIKHPTTALYNDVYARKWQGYAYWRGTVVYTLQVNASPFQSGIYALSYLPVCGAHQSSYTRWVNAHYDGLWCRSQLPQVNIDVSHDTSAVLRVPYASSNNKVALDLPSGSIREYHDIGDINIWPISPLLTGAGQDSTAGFTLWAHMEDVHLEVPVCPQSSYVPKSKTSGALVKRMPMESEQATKNIGPISAAAQGFGKGFKSLERVPMLKHIAAPAAWACDIAAGVAGVFGWSKPTNLDVQTRMQKDLMYGMQHVDGSDNSKTLALFQNNTVEVLPGFSGTDMDEMTIDSIVTRPFINSRTTWSASNAGGALLANFDIGPYYQVATTRDGLGVIYNSPLAMVAQYFQFWRGDICFTIQLAKTNMHSGRLEITYTPYNNYNTPITPSSDQRSYQWREIIDIRDESKFTFRVPFHFFRSYRPCTSTGSFGKAGIIRIYVLDELVAPTTAPQTIDMIIWMHAAPGFEFAVPRACGDMPVWGLTPVYTQSSMTIKDGPGYTRTIGNAVPVDDFENEHARKCIGEKVTSLRQLCRATKFMMNLDPSAIPASNILGIQPFSYPVVTRVSATTTIPEHGGDLISMLGACYALSRGGVRIKTVTDSAGLAMTYLRVRQSDGAQPMFYSDTGTFNGNLVPVVNAVAAVSSVSDRGGTEVAIPAYGPCHARANADCIFDKTLGLALNRSNPPIFYESITTNPRVLRVARGGADDFNMGLFVSVPAVYAASAPT